MIRRDIELRDGTSAWLLVSQVEHARISGEIVRAWSGRFSDEVVAAVAHHDDGWAAWETKPQLDPQHGRPLSFMEMAIADALAIWDRSIAAARSFGPLAGALVAGHFIGLARGSAQAADPLAENWLREMENQRDAWLVEWQSVSSSNTLPMANRGQQMLLVADLLSLWLCCDGPVSGGDAGPSANSEMKSRTATVLGSYKFVTQAKSMRNAEIIWQGSLEPWPFAADHLKLVAPAMAAPAAKYQSWQQIAAACQAVCLVWQLQQTLPHLGKC